jgi:hypothetical protein
MSGLVLDVINLVIGRTLHRLGLVHAARDVLRQANPSLCIGQAACSVLPFGSRNLKDSRFPPLDVPTAEGYARAAKFLRFFLQGLIWLRA